MNSTPEKCIILLEDVDAAFKSREGNNNSTDCGEKGEGSSHLAYEGAGPSKVTFRGLLNALDGVASTEGRILVVTTNYINRLDPALVRPGRVDVKIHVDYPTSGQIIKMFKRFYPKAKDDLGDTFLHILIGMDKKVSMAAIQGLFLMFKNDPEQAIQNADAWLNDEYFDGMQNDTQIEEDLLLENVEKQDEKEGESKKQKKKSVKNGNKK
jgi:chaperone BCS1